MDAEIIRLYKGGKREESLRRFAESYQQRLYTLAYRILGNHDDALDALQETLIHVSKSLSTFKGGSSLYTWAFRLATNVCLNYQRKIARRGTNKHLSLDELLVDSVLLPVARPENNPDLMCRTQFRQHIVEQALTKLPEAQRAVLALCDLDEMTAPEAAEVLGIKSNAVKSRLHRARANLKKTVESEFKKLGIEIDGVHTFECTWQYLNANSSDRVLVSE